MNTYYVYIMTNKSRTLCAGVTNDLEWRVRQHKAKQIAGFTARYNVTRLAFYESFANVSEAIAAEKKIKGWTRAKKIQLIESQNPKWVDLAADWHSDLPAGDGSTPTPTRRWTERVPGHHSPCKINERSFGVPQDDNRAKMRDSRTMTRDHAR